MGDGNGSINLLKRVLLVLALPIVVWNLYTGATIQEIDIFGLKVTLLPKTVVPPSQPIEPKPSPEEVTLDTEPSRKSVSIKSGGLWQARDLSASLSVSRVYERYLLAELTDANNTGQEMHISKGDEFIIEPASGSLKFKLVDLSFNKATFQVRQ